MRLVLFLAACVAASLAGAATFQEDFSADPLSRGWRVFGNTNLFHWNPADQDFEVTWDSSQTNSYFQFPLGTILGRDDDFSFSLDLRLDDITPGVNPAKPWTFEVAFGLQNSADAQKPTFLRGKKPANLAEFDFFPDTGYGATVWPAYWSTNSTPNYNGASDYTVVDLPLGVVLHITLAYSAGTQTMLTTITANGVGIGPIHPVPINSNFTDFRLGTFAIESYSDAGQTGSLLAHGVVDNVVVNVPPPPVANLCGNMINGVWQAQFVSRTNWVYTLECTKDFQSWTAASTTTRGNGAILVLPATNLPPAGTFYRVRAERP
jgi:hypothetical protein